MGKKRQRTECRDCGTETLPWQIGLRAEYYMVRNKVWKAAGMKPASGCLCIGCLESRVGRKLHRGDFTRAELNDLAISDVMEYAFSWRTKRLRHRMTREKKRRE